jgi:surface protein
MDWNKYRGKHSHQTNDSSELRRKFLRHMELQEIPMNEALTLQGSITAPAGGGEPFYEPFISTWRTSSTNETITLPYESTGEYTGIIDWGDGTTSPNSFLTSSHTYATAGDYIVTVNGKCYGFRFNNSGDRTKIRSVQQWGSMRVGNLGSYFTGCTNLSLTGVSDVLDTTNTTNFTEFFSFCSSLSTVSKLNEWDTSNVTNMRGVFRGATLFNSYIGSWNTSKVTDMSIMFWLATSFNQDISTKVINQNQANQYVAWDVSKVIRMELMFQQAATFNQPIGNWDVSNVTTMYQFFQQASSFNQPIGDWNVSKVQNMFSFFLSASSFNQYIGGWNLIGIRNSFGLQSMFQNAIAFNQDLSTKVINQGRPDQYVAWDLKGVVNVSSMLRNATAFNQDIGNWDVTTITNFSNFMLSKTDANYSSANLDSIYNGWSAQTVQSGRSINFGTIKYTSAGQAGKDILINTYGWTIVDGGLAV